MGDRVNGLLHCKIDHTWTQTVSRVDDMHRAITEMREYLPHLEKLEDMQRSDQAKLQALQTIATTNVEIRDRLLGAATGKDHLETKTAVLLFKILGIVIIGLLTALVFFLTSGNIHLLNMK